MTRQKHIASKSETLPEASLEFVRVARALECDESEERFNEALGKIARHKPKAANNPASAIEPKGNDDESSTAIKAG